MRNQVTLAGLQKAVEKLQKRIGKQKIDVAMPVVPLSRWCEIVPIGGIALKYHFMTAGVLGEVSVEVESVEKDTQIPMRVEIVGVNGGRYTDLQIKPGVNRALVNMSVDQYDTLLVTLPVNTAGVLFSASFQPSPDQAVIDRILLESQDEGIPTELVETPTDGPTDGPSDSSEQPSTVAEPRSEATEPVVGCPNPLAGVDTVD